MDEGSDGGTVGLELAGSFPAAAKAGNAALLRALSIDPAVILCDLSRVTGDLDERALRQLLDTGGLLEHWPGTALVLVTPQRVEGPVLAGYGAGRRTGVIMIRSTRRRSTSRLTTGAVSGARPRAQVHIDQHPRAARQARDFVSRTCLDWQLAHVIASAVLVVSELVSDCLRHGTDLDVAISTTRGRLLISVRDGAGGLPVVPPPLSGSSRSHGRHLVAGLSRAWGSLPQAAGGSTVWAVLDT